MFVSEHISQAAHWWRAENDVDDEVYSLLLFLFRNLDALYVTVSNFPKKWAPDETTNICSSGTHGMYLDIPLAPGRFAILRSAISLSGDIFCIVKRLSNLNIGNISDSVIEFGDYLDEFRELRNFFAHLDDRLADLDHHGITGEHDTNCGIRYTKNSKGCFHMLIIGNTLHFSSEGVPMEIDLGKPRFNRILELSKNIYIILTSHDLHKETSNYPDVHEIYTV